MARPRKDAGGKPAKDKLIESAFMLVRSKGYAATTVDELCEGAGVTKGTFFHYFTSKDDLAVEAVRQWAKLTGDFFQGAPYHEHPDPLDRFLGYIRLRRDAMQGNIADFTCLAGTMVQEVYDSHPEIRQACHDSIFNHAERLEADIQEAIQLYQPKDAVNARSLALYTQAVLQGAFILTKASSELTTASACVDHLIRYIEMLFNKPKDVI